MARSKRTLWLVGALWSAGFASSALLAGSCTEIDPDHCRHRGGDEVCPGATPYCNECLASDQNAGCVAEQPDGACYFGGDNPFADDTGTTTGMMGTSTGDDGPAESSTGGPVDCTDEGARDEACPESAPFCVGGTCATCQTAGGDGFCSGVDGTPVCGPLGECVECSAENTAQCDGDADAPFCGLDGTCSGCYQHAQCGEAGCDLYTGECLPEGLVIYVSGPPCMAAGDTGNGTMNNPYCSIQQANGALAPQTTVRIEGPGVFADAPLVASGDEVLAILGDGGTPEVAIVQAANGARVYTDSLRIGEDGPSLAACNTNGKMWFSQTDLIGNSAGVGIAASSGCEVTLERTVIAQNDGNGITATDATLNLRSVAVMANGSSSAATRGIDLDDSSMVGNHITVIENQGNAGGVNLACGGDSALELRNSIVMGMAGDSFAACDDGTVANSAVDDDSYADDATGVVFTAFMPSFFVDPGASDPHLQAGTPFEGVAVWAPGDPRVDLDGEVLNTVPGDTNFAGCDQRP